MALAALPAEGMATFRMPSSTHMEMAQASPRALNEAVGFSPSSFTHRSLGADARAQPLGADERRPALAQRDDGFIGRRQKRRIAPHVRRAVGHLPPSPAMPDLLEVIPHQQRTAAGAKVGNHPCVQPVVAQAALQMRRFRHPVESLTLAAGGAAQQGAPGARSRRWCRRRRARCGSLPPVRLPEPGRTPATTSPATNLLQLKGS